MPMAENALHRVFAHLSTPNALAYRAVLGVFVQAKERFRLHLRPDEVWNELTLEGQAMVGERAALDLLLSYLVEHGNLVAAADTGDVRTIEDFYRARFLFQSSRAGEAAEAAICLFQEQLEAPGELQTLALADIRQHLGALVQLATTASDDAIKAHQTISQLFHRFDGLAEQARTFIASLQRAFHLHAAPVSDFLAYKDHLIGYLERFLGELAISSGEIVSRLEELEAHIERLLAQASARALADRLRSDERSAQDELKRWRRRWAGLRSWFIGGADGVSQASLLRRSTRAAIPEMLAALSDLHDRRLQRSDRVADLRELARWFAAAADDAQAHAIFHAAFLLSPSRHLYIDQETLDAREQRPVAATTSWLVAEPMRILPRLRASGRLNAPGRRAVVLDHGLEKAALRLSLAEQAQALQLARDWIVTGRARRLSEFHELPEDAFRILLDCLAAALIQQGAGATRIRCQSDDGSLTILAQALPGEPLAAVSTAIGTLTGPDWLLTISESWQASDAMAQPAAP
jgi:uncharacterized protein (TIGR02677 family)